MPVYSLLFFITSYFALITEKFKNRTLQGMIYLVIIVTSAIITGTRYFLGGYDIYNYFYFFERTPVLSQLNLFGIVKNNGIFGSDVGYLAVNSLIKTLGFSFFGATLLISTFFYASLYLFFRRYNVNVLVCLIFFFYKAFLDLTFIYMRQCIAVAIALIAFNYLSKSRYLTYAALIFLASTMHFTAIILLVLIPLKKIKLTKKRIIIITLLLCLSYVVVFLDIKIFTYIAGLFSFLGGSATMKVDSAAGLNDLYASTITSPLHLLEFLVLDFMLIKSIDKIEYSEKNNTIIWIFICALPIYTIFANEEIFIRMKYYFILSYPIIFYLIISTYKDIYKYVCIVIACLWCFAGMYKFGYQFDSGNLYHYHSYITKNVSIFLKDW
ncbi:EpsG family protein [Enterococcus viikkiensis]|uniref:EpsG family protein n=1 Tax=Enterococcus viikkiensis TaxID=930854 RepID=UPI0010F6443F|nr:EpsG family protein [Enterococcus viikkiensis]